LFLDTSSACNCSKTGFPTNSVQTEVTCSDDTIRDEQFCGCCGLPSSSSLSDAQTELVQAQLAGGTWFESLAGTPKNPVMFQGFFSPFQANVASIYSSSVACVFVTVVTEPLPGNYRIHTWAHRLMGGIYEVRL
jgi:hypothetical protein